MKHSCLYLFGLAHVPEVLAQITAGSSGNIHLGVVLVVTLRTFPFVIIINCDFTVPAAYVAIIGFGVKFRILNIIVNIPNNL